MQGSIKTFRHVRARVRPKTEEGWRAAWVEHLAQDAVRIRLHAPSDLESGTEVEVVCYGDGSIVRFSGLIAIRAGTRLAALIVGPMTYEPSTESVRLFIESVKGSLRLEGEKGEFVARDASPESVGGIANRAFAVGSTLDLDFGTPAGQFKAEATVANCRPDVSDPEWFRIGLRIVRASRLDSALWQRMLRERADAF